MSRRFALTSPLVFAISSPVRSEGAYPADNTKLDLPKRKNSESGSPKPDRRVPHDVAREAYPAPNSRDGTSTVLEGAVRSGSHDPSPNGPPPKDEGRTHAFKLPERPDDRAPWHPSAQRKGQSSSAAGC